MGCAIYEVRTYQHNIAVIYFRVEFIKSNNQPRSDFVRLPLSWPWPPTILTLSRPPGNPVPPLPTVCTSSPFRLWSAWNQQPVSLVSRIRVRRDDLKSTNPLPIHQGLVTEGEQSTVLAPILLVVVLLLHAALVKPRSQQ